jgi:cytochrome c oxidase assembly factor 4
MHLFQISLMSLLDENMKMTDCYFEKKDWRLCKNEVRCFHDWDLAMALHFISRVE